MKSNNPRRILGAIILASLILGLIFVWEVGGVLVAPSNHPVGDPPPSLHAVNVSFPSASGATIHGWFLPNTPTNGAVVLMHGIHADRRSLEARAKFLRAAGYAVLLFDFQAHGESQGKQITLGFLESRDAAAGVNFVREKLPGARIGVIGVSLGAAAALLAHPHLPVQAMILESCYPTIYQATEDRMIVRFGWFGKVMTPLLVCQLKPRLGIGLDDLKPLECARTIDAPKFFMAGSSDQDTTIAEARSLFAAAAEPKQAWWVAGAAHVDLHKFAKNEYESRVLAFLQANLR